MKFLCGKRNRIIVLFCVCLLIVSSLCFILMSCNKKRIPVYLHDRHYLSYRIFEDFFQTKPHSSLILFDYHHDASVSYDEFDTAITSANWVGHLIETGLVHKVYWLSGRTLLLPNRNSRMDWLERSLKDLSPSRADFIKSKIELIDYHDLLQLKFKTPVAVSLDLDVLTIDPGPSERDFLIEITSFIKKIKPEVMSIALSSSYQKNPKDAWSYVEICAHELSAYEWFLDAEGEVLLPETNEELVAWKKFDAHPFFWKNPYHGFYRGSSQWLLCPRPVKDALIQNKIKPHDQAALLVLDAWQDAEHKKLEARFSESDFNSYVNIIRNTSLEFFSIDTNAIDTNAIDTNAIDTDARSVLDVPSYEECIHPDGDVGLAVRFINKNIDRGCLALWRGVKDLEKAIRYCTVEALQDYRYDAIQEEELSSLEIELTIFGPWHSMDDAFDFRSGFDSVLLTNERGSTLLQASLARERQLNSVEFLQVLSKKAGLYSFELESKDGSISFSKSVSVFQRVPFVIP